MTVSNPAWAELISTFRAEFIFWCAKKNTGGKKAVYTLLVSQMKRNYHSPFLIRTAAQEPNTEGVLCRRVKTPLWGDTQMIFQRFERRWLDFRTAAINVWPLADLIYVKELFQRSLACRSEERSCASPRVAPKKQASKHPFFRHRSVGEKSMRCLYKSTL